MGGEAPAAAGSAADRIEAAGLEATACPLCGSEPRTTLYQLTPPYAVRRCRPCRLAYLSPRLPEAAMRRLYRDASYFEGSGVGYESYAEQEPALRATFRRLLRELATRGVAGGSLLEVGCGHGFLLDEAARYHEHRVGTDYSPQSCAAARRHADRVVEGGVEDLPAGERFDCILAIQVLEHVYHPRAFLAELVGRLLPGGRVLIATPDFGSPWRRLMGRRWPSFKVPEHVLYFDRASLTRAMREAGLGSIERVPYPHAFPLPLVASKLGLSLPARLGTVQVWLPRTTIALTGVGPA